VAVLIGACSGAPAGGLAPTAETAHTLPAPANTLSPATAVRNILTPSVTRPPAATALPSPIPLTPTPVSGLIEIKVEDYVFIPAFITITAGTTVHWVPVGSAEHSIVPRDPPVPWRGGATAGLGSPTVEWTFDTPGTYSYFCDYHPAGMEAVLVVIGTP
jgi:plastocyanin